MDVSLVRMAACQQLISSFADLSFFQEVVEIEFKRRCREANNGG
jgi:hypothetical protein